MQNKRAFSSNSQTNTHNRQANSSQTITFLLVSDQRFALLIPYNNLTANIKSILKKYSCSWNPESKLWEAHIDNYNNCLNELREMLRNNSDSKIQPANVLKIPDFAFSAIQPMPLDLDIKNNHLSTIKTIKYSQLETNIDPTLLSFYNKLYDFQKSSLEFGIKKHGRVLLADEMGVGKTIQSLAIACIFRHEWPLLIICPSSLRLNWQQEILSWAEQYVKKPDIQVYSKGGSVIKENIKVLIVSYDLAWRMKEQLEQYKVVIVDEAHYLKNSGNKRSDILTPFLSSRKRIILLTGTPALARPREIFNLISIVRPDIFLNFKEFGHRYCEPTINPWSRAVEYNGCQNPKQLFYILKDRVMIRRLKREVLTQLPDKQRQKVFVQTDKNIIKEIKQLLNGQGQDNGIDNFVVDILSNLNNQHGDSMDDARQAISKVYSLTGQAKLDSAKEYILQLLQNNIKLIVFAHHIAVLDGLQEAVKSKNYKYMRIDGSVSLQKRHENVMTFQENAQVMVALLSISAAGVGLTLTASSTVVFVQLHWTPGMMIQAEDRAHRIGQKSSVNCHYLIGDKTLDTILYRFLQKKITNVASFVDGKEERLQMQAVEKGEKGKVSIAKLAQVPIKSKFPNLLFKFESVKPIIDKYYSDHQYQESQISDSVQSNQIALDQDLETCGQQHSTKRHPYQINEEISNQKQTSTNKKQEGYEKNIQKERNERQSSQVCDLMVENQSQILQMTQEMRQQQCETEETL